MSMKDEWRCVMMESGRLFATDCGLIIILSIANNNNNYYDD